MQVKRLGLGRIAWIPALAIALPSVVSAWSLGGPQLNADTILYSIMSHQKVTLFYWGQNRLANLVAALLWPLGDVNCNLAAVLVVHTLAWHGLLWLVARTVQPQQPARDGTLATYALLVALTHLLLTPEARYVLMAEGQPYALSYLALGLGWHWLQQPQLSLARGGGGTVLLAAGLGLNPGLAPAVGALALATAGATRQGRRPALVLAGAAALAWIWLGLARLVGVEEGNHDYVTWQLADQKAHFAVALANLARAIRLPWLLAMLAGLGLLLPWTPVGKGSAGPQTRWLTAGAAVLAAAWLVLFSSNAWVLANQLHYKYFFPVFLVAVWGLALLAAHAVRLGRARLPDPLPRPWGLSAAALLLLACPAVAGEPRWKVEQFGALAKALGTRDQLPATQGPLLVGGDYWQVWPLVHQALQRGQRAFGTAERATAMRSELKLLLQDQENTKALGYVCVGLPVPRCMADLEQLTARPWQVRDQQSCGEQCQWLQVESPQSAWICPERLEFGSGGNVPLWATAGLGGPEAHGRWTVERRITLACRWPDQRPPRALRLTASAFLPMGVPRQCVLSGLAGAKGHQQAEWTTGQGSQSAVLNIEQGVEGWVTLDLRLPDAVAPATLGLSHDPRPLALSLQTGQWVW